MSTAPTSLSLGNDYINNSLAAVLIGGNAIEGGKGGVWGCVLGAFFMMLLFALLTMLSIGQVGKLIVQGLIIFGVAGILPPTTSALLHNASTLAISLKSMTNLLPAAAV